jgi:hypothetical protein
MLVTQDPKRTWRERAGESSFSLAARCALEHGTMIRRSTNTPGKGLRAAAS